MSLVISDLYKSYGKQQVLNGINLSVSSGEIVGFLGNNGAGKSTTMKIITGYLSADRGNVDVCGINVSINPLEAHRKIGYLPEHNPIYPEMYVKEYLLFVAGMYKLEKNAKSKVNEMIEKTGLTKEYKKKIGMLSKGYRQRIGLAQALIPDPEVLILDEPTTGLDPNQIIEVRNLIKEVGKEKTVMLSTHIMQEVSAICERVIIINKGNIVVDGKEDVIMSQPVASQISIIVEYLFPQDIDTLMSITGVLSVKELSFSNTYLLTSNQDIRISIYEDSVMRGVKILTLKHQETSLEEIYRSYTQ